MSAKICFFPVGNGDMTLIQTEDDKNILIDCRIRDGEEHPDVRTQLREKLPRNNEGRLFVHLLFGLTLIQIIVMGWLTTFI